MRSRSALIAPARESAAANILLYETRMESHLIFAHDAKIISENEFVALVTETIRVRKMLYGLIKRVSSLGPPADPPTASSR
jgi:hypothetical protein